MYHGMLNDGKKGQGEYVGDNQNRITRGNKEADLEMQLAAIEKKKKTIT